MALADRYLLKINRPEPNFNEANANKEYIDFVSIFGNENPVDLEIGCGMGDFAIEYALKNPNRNLVAVEIVRDILVVALEKTSDKSLENLRFLAIAAEYLPKFFPCDSVERIFLNFSTPFPKKSYAKKRLTSERFLKEYKEILVDGGKIVQKTDNIPLFDFSLDSLRNNGFEITEMSYDLYSDNIPDNIATEYEKKFVAAGTKICRLVAVNKK